MPKHDPATPDAATVPPPRPAATPAAFTFAAFLAVGHNRRFLAFLALALPLLALVALDLLVPLLTTLLSWSLVRVISERLVLSRVAQGRARFVALTVVALVIVALLAAIAAGTWAFLHSGDGIERLIERMSEILAEAHRWLPPILAEHIPERDTLFSEVSAWLTAHGSQLGGVGLEVAKQFGYALLGIILGALIAVTDINRAKRLGSVSARLIEQLHAFNRSFINVAGAQVRISAVNTALTAFYLFAILPALDVHLPLRKTMLVVTFCVGLLPVLGNLVSNTVIIIISIGYSLPVAIGSLVYLVVIHKLEYFLNARFVGSSIAAHAWEILLVMIIGERLFGLPGVVFAPVFYAWLKSEWHEWDHPPSRRAALERP